ncbi:hypothetical protein Taro_034316 [Colocasia esculenta]|uniref:DYW domain-containing protein n=1 Tax=Colocasia esculenta TaxID=4460 RepID=A0A843VXH7_COLES|nr:hypothetical protein [Colocasia esculenta]
MRRHGVRPDLYTFPFLLQPLSSPSHLPSGRRLHAHVLLFGLLSDTFAQNSLVSMYSNCGSLGDARRLFDEIRSPDVPTWNSIVAANLRWGFADVARRVFDAMPERSVVSWTCMIEGHVKCGDYKGALELFREMQKAEAVLPNEFTMSSVLSACGRLGALEHGKWAHAFIDKCGMRVDAVLGTCLIDMYAKCGSIERALQVFDGMGDDQDVTAWSAMLTGLAVHGRSQECLALFDQMLSRSVTPNAVTFLGVLCACVHGGLVEEGREYFDRMSLEFGIAPLIQHYGCIVDLYGRAGMINQAWEVVRSMPMKADVLIWGALLSGSRLHGDRETCELALKNLIELEPLNSGAHVLLSNLYAKMGRWADVRRVRGLMEAKGVKKTPGCAMVEIGGDLYEFLVGDRTHPETRDIYLMLEEIMRKLKAAGYVANTGEVLLDLDEEAKEAALAVHSEKLAIAFCFIRTAPGTALRVVKNLRVCVDCHTAIKLISEIYEREIVVRDCSRFHHFRHGSCSCADFW